MSRDMGIPVLPLKMWDHFNPMPSQRPASCGRERLGSSGGARAGVLSLGLPGFADGLFLSKKKNVKSTHFQQLSQEKL